MSSVGSEASEVFNSSKVSLFKCPHVSQFGRHPPLKIRGQQRPDHDGKAHALHHDMLLMGSGQD
jgi:hypothetical protein